MKERLFALTNGWSLNHKALMTKVLVLCIILGGLILRATVYGDLGLSVGHNDTEAYVTSSEVNLLSWNAFTSNLPFTTNLVYQVFRPDGGYQSARISNITTGTISRRDRPGFHNIAIFQSVLSMLAWSSLAWIFSSKLKSSILQIIASGMIILFGFTPQLADWDSVLGTESLSVSLFVVAFALLIELAFNLSHQPKSTAFKIFIFLLFFVSIFLWTFIRDVNPYAMVFLPLFIWGLFASSKIRGNRFILIAGSLVSLLFVLGVLSVRQRPPVGRNLNIIWEVDIMPFPARAQFFTDRGMPAQDSPEFQTWFNDHADTTYMLFLLTHPGYTISNYFEDMNYAFVENMQPYFIIRDLPYRQALIVMGNYFHPVSPAVFLLVCVLFIPLVAGTLTKNQPDAPLWLWLTTWPFFTASATLFLSIFGVPLGLHRHGLSSTVTFRLLLWCLLFIMIDLAFKNSKQELKQIDPGIKGDGLLEN
jgi:hypothetical protein